MGNGATNPVGGLAAEVAADALAIYLEDWGCDALYWPVAAASGAPDRIAGVAVRVYIGGMTGNGQADAGMNRPPAVGGGLGMAQQQRYTRYGLVAPALEPGAAVTSVTGVQDGAIVKLSDGDVLEIDGWTVGRAEPRVEVRVRGQPQRPGGGLWTAEVSV